MKKNWSDEAWDDYLYWQQSDRKILKKINDLINDIERNGENKGIGKTEPLKGNMSGLWSRRIDSRHRLVYCIVDGVLEIITCKEHYSN